MDINSYNEYFNKRMEEYNKYMDRIIILYDLSEKLLEEDDIFVHLIHSFDNMLKNVKIKFYNDIKNNIPKISISDDMKNKILDISNTSDYNIIPKEFITEEFENKCRDDGLFIGL